MANVAVKRTIMGRLPYGSDLLQDTTVLVQKENIKLGRISGLGATTHAVVSFYSQTTHTYDPLVFPGPMEILNIHGNVSMRDGKPFVHIHLILSDAEGKVFGGHLLPGTKLFACELFIDELEGDELVRENDERTGLHLWSGGCLV